MLLGEIISKIFPGEDAFETQQRVSLTSQRRQELADIELSYPGWEQDYQEAQEDLPTESTNSFKRRICRVQDKQSVYEHQVIVRINALASLDLTYPGFEKDRKKILVWSRSHPFNDEMEEIFYDKLQGLVNKSRLYRGDRSHPNIVALDELIFTFPGWEKDYKRTITAHCEEPDRMFEDALHRITEKQCIYEDDRSHWRLSALDKLNLTYPGFDEDMAEVEKWHIDHADSPSRKRVFEEVIDGMLEQEEIYLESWIAKEEEKIPWDQHREENEGGRVPTTTDSTDSLDREAGGNYWAVFATSKRMESRNTPTRKHDYQGGNVVGARPEKDGCNNKRDKVPQQSEFGFGLCVVCHTDSRTHIFLPCGHLCACAACSEHAFTVAGCCPACGQRADQAQKVILPASS